MNDTLLNCWEIMGCRRDRESIGQSNYDECLVSRNSMGHSCWAVAGSMNADKPLCPQVRDKGIKCSFCDVYSLYSRSSGTKALDIKKLFPEENNTYKELVINRLNLNKDSD